MAEEEKGFVIRDRRGRGSETPEGPASIPDEPTADRAQKTQPEERLPPSFLSFVYSLGTSALMLLGEGPKQERSGSPQSLAHAQEIIDVLSILETKTKGNLPPEGETLLQE